MQSFGKNNCASNSFELSFYNRDIKTIFNYRVVFKIHSGNRTTLDCLLYIPVRIIDPSSYIIDIIWEGVSLPNLI